MIERIAQYLSDAFVIAIGLGALAVLVLFVIDISQRDDSVRRNFPVVGRFRKGFTRLGTFFRQYFFAMDREEMPFNRAQRDWVERSSENHDNVLPFGSTKSLQPVGTPIFVNAAWPTLDEDAVEADPLVIGPDCAHPYEAPSFYNMSAMSYGSLSKPAIRALSMGTAKAGCWMNTGEGGLSPWHLEGGGDVVFQLGTAKYGARNPDHTLNEDKFREVAGHEQVRMIELKLAQGAKPGKGGILPAKKVTQEIADIRHIPAGEDSISPNRHVEIASNEQLLDMIERLRDLSGKPVGIKTVMGDDKWLRGFFEAIDRRGQASAPDFITIDSGDGGTGAAPMPLMDNVGMMIHEALPIAVDIREEYGLKDRVRLIASGKQITPSDTAWALATGADFINAARGFMFAIGCIQAMKCDTNRCPTGVTTHNKRLQRGLVPADKAERVNHFVRHMRKEVGIIAHSCGVRSPRELDRHHVRVVCPDGRTRLMSDMHPGPALQE